MAEWSIRPGVVGDAAGLHALGEVVTRATYTPIDPAEAERTLRTWWTEDALTESLGRLQHWVAEDAGGRLVGVANLGRRDDRAVLWKLYVHPDQQRTGLGRALLHEVLDALSQEPLWLSYLAGNDNAGDFYAAHGFVEVERVPDPPYPDQVWMRRDP